MKGDRNEEICQNQPFCTFQTFAWPTDRHNLLQMCVDALKTVGKQAYCAVVWGFAALVGTLLAVLQLSYVGCRNQKYAGTIKAKWGFVVLHTHTQLWDQISFMSRSYQCLLHVNHERSYRCTGHSILTGRKRLTELLMALWRHLGRGLLLWPPSARILTVIYDQDCLSLFSLLWFSFLSFFDRKKFNDKLAS